MVFLEKIFGKRSSSVDNDIVSYEKTELEKLLLRRIVELRVDEAVVIENVLPSKVLKQEIKDAHGRDKDRIYDAYDKYPYLMAIYDISEKLRYGERYKEIMSREAGVAFCIKYVGRRLRDYVRDDVVQSRIKLMIKELLKNRKQFVKDPDHSKETLRKMDKYISACQEMLLKK